MSHVFHHIDTDQTATPMSFEGIYAGPIPSTCWVIGGGPSLAQLPVDEIARSPSPKMGINLAGVGLIRPNFWTAYDPSPRFLRSIYLDPSIMKFVPRRRWNDFIPETSFKICEAPHMYFFERDVRRGFANFLDRRHSRIVDWSDTFAQAIDILYQLGFRRLLLAGCEMRVRPSRSQIQLAASRGVTYAPFGRLRDFARDCERAGVSIHDLDRLDAGPHYHFDERKSMRAAVRTDEHYLRIVQALRLSRRSIAAAGMQIISVTPHSRWNDVFPYRPIRRVLREIESEIGTTAPETLLGQYQKLESTVPSRYGPIEDVLPHLWNQPTVERSSIDRAEPASHLGFDDACEIIVERQKSPVSRPSTGRLDRFVRALNRLHDVPTTIHEEG